MASQAGHKSSSSIARNNVIYIAERLRARLETKLPLLESSGIYLDPAPCEKLSESLDCALALVRGAADSLSGRKRDPFANSPRMLADRSAAVLYRCSKQLEVAIAQAKKLECQLRRAKKTMIKRK